MHKILLIKHSVITFTKEINHESIEIKCSSTYKI